jgi:hypothetical protein
MGLEGFVVLKVFQCFAFVGGEFFRYPYMDLDEETTTLAAFAAGKALTFDFKDFAREGAWGDFEGLCFATQKGNLERSS